MSPDMPETAFDAITLMHRVTTRLAAQNHQPADLETIRARQAAFAAACPRPTKGA